MYQIPKDSATERDSNKTDDHLEERGHKSYIYGAKENQDNGDSDSEKTIFKSRNFKISIPHPISSFEGGRRDHQTCSHLVGYAAFSFNLSKGNTYSHVSDRMK
ncbi:Hypothetical predicted protein [Octopus vulgaris]|uniref:Uncharacterized protein n=1 Tax=Octopus vulgaris TaxID=6645 RepID=A0AA36AN78_OCTVU|nr:Hypothetical predicted protein [Octopus vulgaris]